MRCLLGLILLCGGCLDGGGSDLDMGMTDVDMSIGELPDLAKADLTGLLNCAALDKAESMCKATNATCVMELRKMATPSAVAKDEALQQCFHMYCPLGTGMVCEPNGNGDYTPACIQCVNNTLKASQPDCTPTTATECAKCYNQGQACINDG